MIIGATYELRRSTAGIPAGARFECSGGSTGDEFGEFWRLGTLMNKPMREAFYGLPWSRLRLVEAEHLSKAPR